MELLIDAQYGFEEVAQRLKVLHSVSLVDRGVSISTECLKTYPKVWVENKSTLAGKMTHTVQADTGSVCDHFHVQNNKDSGVRSLPMSKPSLKRAQSGLSQYTWA